jgi:hypothetical protein
MGTLIHPEPALDLFLMENLLTARRDSMFPTNGAGFDEDVNVYLAGLLSRFLRAGLPDGVTSGAGPLLNMPPPSDGRRRGAAVYRANADHRLLHLGLFARGDGQRRQAVWNGMSAVETRDRDLSAGQTCYLAAADLLRGRLPEVAGLVAVWDKIALHFDDYVHVLGVLATRRLGLGARLGEADLSRLLPPASAETAQAVDTLLAEAPPPVAIDTLLDLWLAHAKNPEPHAKARIRDLAAWLGVRLPLA